MTSNTALHRPTEPTTTSLGSLASATKSDRNRAIDAYRVLAMGAVAIGHWVAMAVSVDPDGSVSGGNALSSDPSLSFVSWFLQVMPLFFVVGGFSSAMSLDSHARVGNGDRPQDWVYARLRRMVASTSVLAATWLALLVTGTLTGTGAIVAAGSTAAAIPLWFLANYTIDTAIAPAVLPAFRRNPALVAGGGAVLFCLLEASRFAGVPYLSQLNWVLGWLLFQVAGFAWRDGLLPSGHRLIAIAGGFWAAAATAVTVGPYPVSMVHFDGITNSPTNPPSLALMFFGAAYSATAVAAAPWVSARLAERAGLWRSVIAANTVAMSVYLWHMTAAVAASAVLYAFGALPTADIGTAAWWIQKLPIIGLSVPILAAVVAMVARFEQRALLAPRVAWQGGAASMTIVALALSAGVKIWVLGNVTGVVIGCLTVVALAYGPTRLAPRR